MKKKYILLKETPDLKKGTIVEEECEDKDQNYKVIDKKFYKFPKYYKDITLYFQRDEVEKQPDWFQEICQVEVPKRQLAKVKAFVKSLK